MDWRSSMSRLLSATRPRTAAVLAPLLSMVVDSGTSCWSKARSKKRRAVSRKSTAGRPHTSARTPHHVQWELQPLEHPSQGRVHQLDLLWKRGQIVAARLIATELANASGNEKARAFAIPTSLVAWQHMHLGGR